MRKKYLLIMPRVVKEHGEGYVFPLGISYISSNMKRAGFEIYNLNLNHTNKNWEMELINSIRKNNIYVVAIGGQ